MRRLGQQPSFWLLCAAVFLANALLSALREEWALTILQTVTGVMASVAAVAGFSHSAAPEQGRRSDSDDA